MDSKSMVIDDGCLSLLGLLACSVRSLWVKAIHWQLVFGGAS